MGDLRARQSCQFQKAQGGWPSIWVGGWGGSQVWFPNLARLIGGQLPCFPFLSQLVLVAGQAVAPDRRGFPSVSFGPLYGASYFASSARRALAEAAPFSGRGGR